MVNDEPSLIPRVAVIGPGALGTLFAVRIARAGYPILLLDHRLDRAMMLNDRPLTLHTAAETIETHVPVTADPRNLRQVDLAVVLVKAYQTETVAHTLATHLPPQAMALTLQNGLGNVESLQLHLGQDRVFGGTTAQGAILEAPGVARDTGSGPLVLGRPDHDLDSRCDLLAELFQVAGFAVSVTQDLAGALWTKAIINAAINPIAALTRLRNGQLAENPATLRVMAAVAREAHAIARRDRIMIAEQDWPARLTTVCQATAENVNSMLRDVLNGRRTEIEAINGAITRTAEQHRTRAPLNRMLWYLISTVERHYSTQVPSPPN